jgi:hypothetical protein
MGSLIVTYLCSASNFSQADLSLFCNNTVKSNVAGFGQQHDSNVTCARFV